MCPKRRRYIAWLMLCWALAAHVADEASTGFLDLYNPAVTAMGLPALQFGFPVWITLLALAIAGLLDPLLLGAARNLVDRPRRLRLRFLDARQRHRAPEFFDPQARVDVQSLHVAAIGCRVAQILGSRLSAGILSVNLNLLDGKSRHKDVENPREKTAQGISMHHGRRDSKPGRMGFDSTPREYRAFACDTLDAAFLFRRAHGSRQALLIRNTGTYAQAARLAAPKPSDERDPVHEDYKGQNGTLRSVSKSDVFGDYDQWPSDVTPDLFA